MNKLVILICAAIFVVSCSKSAEKNAQQSADPKAKQSAKPVSVIELTAHTISLSKPLPARVEAVSIAEIRPQVDGIIQALSFEQGSYVEKGQQLYQIDPVKYELALKSAQASLENAQAEAELANANKKRFESLLKTNAVSQQENDTAKAEAAKAEAAVSLAEAEIESAKVNLAYTKVYAPITGYIGPSSATEGALVTAQQQQALAIIRKLDPVYVDITQSAVDATQLYPSLINSDTNTNATISVRLFMGQRQLQYEQVGELVATDLAVEESTGTIRFRAVFPNPDGLLLPGTFVRATIEDPNASKRLLVPQKAVSIGSDGAKSVWLVDSRDKVAKRSVQASKSYENNWVIDSGLQQGDLVVVEGLMSLREGMKVTPQKINEEANTTTPKQGASGE